MQIPAAALPMKNAANERRGRDLDVGAPRDALLELTFTGPEEHGVRVRIHEPRDHPRWPCPAHSVPTRRLMSLFPVVRGRSVPEASRRFAPSSGSMLGACGDFCAHASLD